MEILVMAGQLILGLSILVGLHELGHLLTAKFFGMRVEQYSIGFPPKVWGKRFGETEYSIGAIPLGGFVKISGMIDESLDTQHVSNEPKPWEFRAKPAWQRLIVMLGGIIVNIVTGIVIFISLVYLYGDRYYSTREINRYGIVAYPLAESIGLKTGDKILKVNGKPVDDFKDVTGSEVLLGTNSFYTVERSGQVLDVPIPNDLLSRFSDRKQENRFIEPRMPFSVKAVKAGSEADKAGLQAGDKITAINGQSIGYYHELKAALDAAAARPVNLQVLRSGQTVALSGRVNADGTLGFQPNIDLKSDKIEYTFGQSVVEGTKRAFGVIWLNVKGFAKIFRGEVSPSKALSGPIGIAENIFGGEWVWENFWAAVGLLSMALAFMNALPIPALDGGHAVFLLYEMVAGRAPSDRFLENAQKVGMVILLGLIVFAFGNDLYKIFARLVN
jgi:regulator of sigma E protease